MELSFQMKGDRCTTYQLRAAASKLGVEVSGSQILRFVDIGLLPEAGEDDRWPPRTLVALIRVVRAGRSVRSLDRRVVRLRRDYRYFPVKPDKLHAAMQRVLPQIDQPVRKMRAVDRYARSPLPSRRAMPPISTRSLGVVPVTGAGGRLRERTIPYREDWARLLGSIGSDQVEVWATGWYALFNRFLPAWYAPDPDPLASIPFEERVVLYAILDISGHRPMKPGLQP